MTSTRRDPPIPKELAEQLPRHLLALEVRYRLKGEAAPRVDVYSGFAVAHRGLLFWITADHCLQNLKQLRDTPSVQLEAVRLHDQYAHPAARSIPTDLETILQWAFGDRETDVGISLPRQMIQDLVAANPQVKPLSFDSPIPAGFKHSCYCIVGFPDELQKPGINTRVCCITTRLDVQEGDPCFPVGHTPKQGCMYGLIDTKSFVESIVGMSGGPVFEISQNGERWHWRLIGVQSSWFANLQLVCVARAERLKKMADDICNRVPGALPK